MGYEVLTLVPIVIVALVGMSTESFIKLHHVYIEYIGGS
jgi:hypothetical protein